MTMATIDQFELRNFEYRKVAFGIADLKSRYLKNNSEYKLFDINFNLGYFTQKKKKTFMILRI